MRSVSYHSSQYSNSAYSSPYNYSKLSNPAYRSTTTALSNSSATSPKTADQTSAAKTFRKSSVYSREHPNAKTSSAFATDSGVDTAQNPQTKFSVEQNSATTQDRYSLSSTSRFRPTTSRKSTGKSYTAQRQNSLNPDELSDRNELSSRFTSNQKWSTNAKDRGSSTRSKSVEPSSRKYSEPNFTNRKASDVSTYYSDKRTTDNYYSYTENRDGVNTAPSSSLYSSPVAFPSSNDSLPARKDYRMQKENKKPDAVNQQEFFQRLFRAHSIVDELLKERGLKFEEEPKYYRRWEPAEVIEEEVPHSPDRRSSSASDSGLSMDTESEGSLNAESAGKPSVPATVESDLCEKTFVKSSQNEYVLIVRLWALILQTAFTATIPRQKEQKSPANSDTEECYCDASFNAADRTLADDQAYVEAVAATATNRDKFAPNQKTHQSALAKKTFQQHLTSIKKPLDGSKSSTPSTLVSDGDKLQQKRSPKFPGSNLSVTQKPETHIAPIRRCAKTPNQLTVGKNFRKKNQLCRSSAEISIQHVSFYQVAQSLVEKQCPAEKSVRVHLRLTERAQTCLQASTILYIKNLLLRISSDIISAVSANKPKQKSSINGETLKDSTSAKRKGNLAKRKELIKPIHIPGNFLKTLNPTATISKDRNHEANNELRTMRGKLKRVPFNRTISGPSLAVYEAQDKRYSFTSPAHPINDFNINTLKLNVAAKKQQMPKINGPDQKSSIPSAANSTANITRTGSTPFCGSSTTTAAPSVVPATDATKTSKSNAAPSVDIKGSTASKAEINTKNSRHSTTTSINAVDNLQRSKPGIKGSKKSNVQTVDVKNKENDPKNSKGSRRRVVTSAGESGALNTEASVITTALKNSCHNKPEKLNRKNNLLMTGNKPGRSLITDGSSSNILQYKMNGKHDLITTKCSGFETDNVVAKCISGTVKRNDNKRVVLKEVSSALNSMPIVAEGLLAEKTRVIPEHKLVKSGSLLPTYRIKLKHSENKNCSAKAVKLKHHSSTSLYSKKCSDEEVKEVEAEETKEVRNQRSPEESEEETRFQKLRPSNENEELTEAEKAMLAARKRQEEDQAAKLLDYKEHRRVEREKEEEELRALKEKQERRRLEREREEREFAARQEQEEKRRRQEEEERKAKFEADRKKKEEEKKKRAQTTFNAVNGGQIGGRNFVIPTKTDRADKFGNIVQAKQEMGMTKEQQEEAKRNYMATFARSIDIPATDLPSLREKIRVLHQKICRLEADKYDLEKRQERQEYDLRELNERQRQVARNKALKKGIDPADSLSSRYPPKVSIISKYDRQSDRRNFSERRAVFESKNAFPCFPNVPPPPTVYEKVILKLDNENDDEDDDERDDYDEESDEN